MAAEVDEETTNAWDVARRQLDDAAARMDLEAGVHEVLRHPRRALEVSVPTRLDDGSVKVFKGYRVHHNTSRGPSKGGIGTTRTSPSTRSRPWRCG